ncbi:MAG: hypothetical protein LQ350_003852 [Teloschistes chrysophthalmus]|nr:MAG: hypothetical protein LQ350_003852 [Niorma chrysophthalma]
MSTSGTSVSGARAILLSSIAPMLLLVLFFITSIVDGAPVDGDPIPSFPVPSGYAGYASGADIGDEDVCVEHEDCAFYGEQYWEKLQATLQNPAPTDRSDGPQLFAQYYTAEAEPREDSGERVAQDVITNGFSPLDSGKYSLVTVESKIARPPDTHHQDYVPYRNLFNTAEGIIVALWNYKDYDWGGKLPWSEVMFQTYSQQLQPGESLETLRSVVRFNIANDHTLRMIWTSYDARKIPREGNPQWIKWTSEDQQYLFQGILGTDNVRGVVWLLNDHAAAFEKKTITDIWTRIIQVPGQFGDTVDVWINIGSHT